MLRSAYWDLFKLMDVIDRKVSCAEMRDRYRSVARQLTDTYTYLSKTYRQLMPLVCLYYYNEQADILSELRTPQSNHIAQGDT